MTFYKLPASFSNTLMVDYCLLNLELGDAIRADTKVVGKSLNSSIQNSHCNTCDGRSDS